MAPTGSFGSLGRLGGTRGEICLSSCLGVFLGGSIGPRNCDLNMSRPAGIDFRFPEAFHVSYIQFNRPFSYSKKGSGSNDISSHFVEFSNVYNSDRSSNATQSNLVYKNA